MAKDETEKIPHSCKTDGHLWTTETPDFKCPENQLRYCYCGRHETTTNGGKKWTVKK